jgi:hypothetical protein
VKAVRKKRACIPRTDYAEAPRGLHAEKGECCEQRDGIASFLAFQQKNIRVLHATEAMIGCTRPGTPHAKTECFVVHSKRRGVRRSFGPSGHGAKTKIETAREGDAAVLKRPLRFGMRRRVVWTRPERGREPSRVTLSTRPPRRSRSKSNRSPYAPVALCFRRPSQTYEMPVSPLIFDTTLGVGATEVRATCLYPFLQLRERFETVAAEVTFSPFWVGKFRRRAKTGCVIAHLCRGVSRMSKQNKKNTRRKIPKR